MSDSLTLSPTATAPTLRNAALKGARWTAVAQASRQIVGLFTNLVLARMLVPGDFGLWAIVAVAISLLDLLLDLGTSATLIQRQTVSGRLLSSAFWLNAGAGVVAAGATLLLAPFLAVAFGAPDLEPVLRVTAVAFVLGSLRIVPRALLMRRLDFAPLAKIELAATLLGGVIAVGLACAGAGVWAFAGQTLASTALLTSALFAVTAFRPTAAFCRTSLRETRSFGLCLTGYQLLNFVHEHGDYLLIGYCLGAEQLGLYWLAFRIAVLPVSALSQVVSRVLFPYLSRLGSDQDLARKNYLSLVRTIGLVVFPLLIGLACVAEPFLAVVCGANWAASSGVLIAIVPAALSKCISTTTGAIYLSQGRSDLMLRYGVYYSCVALTAFLIGLPHGILGVAIAYSATVPFTWPNFAVPLGLIGVRMRDLLLALVLPLSLCGVMAITILTLDPWLGTRPPSVRLAGLVATGAIVYLTLLRTFAWGQVRSILRLLAP